MAARLSPKRALHFGHNAPPCNFTASNAGNIIADVLTKFDQIAQPSLEKKQDPALDAVFCRGQWSWINMRRSDLVQHKEKEKGRVMRTSQIVFGERQHLLRVLDSLEG